MNVDARNKLGRLYFESGRDEESRAQFLASSVSQPNWTASVGLGEIDFRHGRASAAEAEFRRALELNSLASGARWGLARIYAARGQKKEAVQEYMAGLAIDPTDSKAKAELEALREKEEDATTTRP